MMEQILTKEDSSMLANSMIFIAEQTKNITLEETLAPYVLMRPKVYLDGDKWCALYGDNLQEGVAGFGDSPAKACVDFDTNWNWGNAAHTA